MWKRIPIAMLAAALVSVASNVNADDLYDWTFTTTSGQVDGSGTMMVADSSEVTVEGYTGYAVTSFAGTYLGETITGLAPVGDDYADNLISSLTGTSEQLDGDGITFSFGPSGTLENLWVPDSGDSEYVGGYGDGSDRETYGGANGTFVAVPVAAPEPSALALAGVSTLGLLWQLRRRK